MRVLFSSTWGYGHVFPLVPLARACAAAGHTVRWATNEQAVALVTAAGLDAVPAGLDGAGVAAVEQRLRAAAGQLAPQDRAAFAFPQMFGEWCTPPMAADLLSVARDWRPDVMVHEPAALAAPLVGAVLGIPTVTHAFGGAIPAAFLVEAGERLAPLWRQHGVPLPPYAGSFAAGYLDTCPPAVQTVPVDHIGTRLPLRPVSYTGERRSPLPAFVVDADPRPLVYLTLGTVQNKAETLAAAVQGTGGLDVRVLVTVGPRGDPSALGPVPAHVRVERWVCQTDVLPHSSVVVSHAGSGTFLGALGLGLPQLCLPQAADQFRNAAGTGASGAGLSLQPHQVQPAAVHAALSRLLQEDGFRAAAAAVAQDVAAMPDPAAVVHTLERLA